MEIAAGTAAGLVGGVVLTLLGTYYFWVLQRSRHELGYDVLSANVLIPGPPEDTPDIQIVVKNTLIDPATPVPDAFSPVEEVLGFRVLLKNTGNEVLGDQIASISLSETAVVLSASFEEQPDLGHERIALETQAGSPNVTRLRIPFLNPGAQLIVSMQSIRNANTDCSVSAGAPGLKTYDLGRRRFLTAVALVAPIVTLLFGGQFAFLILAIVYPDSKDPQPNWVDPAQWAALSLSLLMVGVFMALVTIRTTRNVFNRLRTRYD